MLELEKLLHSKKLRYEKLFEISKDYLNDNSFDTVNIYIDFWSIVKSIYSKDIVTSLKSLKQEEKMMITSEIINLVGHYRHFYASRFKKYTNIIIYYSKDKDVELTRINPEFNKTLYNFIDNTNPLFSVLNEIVNVNIKLIKAFCEFVPHVYMIDTKNVSHTMLPHILIKNSSYFSELNIDNNLNIIITNNKVNYQDLLLTDKILILDLRGKEKSRYISSEILMDVLDTSKKDNNYTVLPCLYTLFMSISGNKSLDIKGIKGYANTKTLNKIQNLLNSNIVSNIEYNNINSLEEVIDNDSFLSTNKEQIVENFKLTNHYMHPYTSEDALYIKSQFVDKIDAKSIRYINDKVLYRYPIILEYVFEGEDYQ